MVEVRNLSKTYGHQLAVKDVSFSFHGGEVFGLLGPNGAGKSTAMMMITGLLASTSGEVIVDGEKYDGRRLRQRRLFGIVPQEYSIYQDLSTLSNLMFFSRLKIQQGRLIKRSKTTEDKKASTTNAGCSEGIVSSAIGDETKRKQVEEQLRKSNAQLRFIMDSMPQKIGTAKPSGEVDYFGPADDGVHGTVVRAASNVGLASVRPSRWTLISAQNKTCGTLADGPSCNCSVRMRKPDFVLSDILFYFDPVLTKATTVHSQRRQQRLMIESAACRLQGFRSHRHLHNVFPLLLRREADVYPFSGTGESLILSDGKDPGNGSEEDSGEIKRHTSTLHR